MQTQYPTQIGLGSLKNIQFNLGGWDWHHPDWVEHHPSLKEKTSLTPKIRMNEFGKSKNKFPPSNSSPHTIYRSPISSG
jgi:hypothetical protein